MVAIPVGSDPDWLFCHIRGWAVNSIRVRVSVHNAGIPEPDRVPQGRARRRQAAGVVRKQPPAEHTSGLSGSSRLDVDSARAAALRAELDRPLRYRPERDRRVSLAAPAALGRRVPYTRPVNWAGGPGAAPHPASGGLDRWCHAPRRMPLPSCTPSSAVTRAQSGPHHPASGCAATSHCQVRTATRTTPHTCFEDS